MLLAISRFRVVNGMEEEVAAAFGRRPHAVERASGFLGLEVFRGRSDSAVFYLVTRWSDRRCFQQWHGSEAHRRSHDGIPSGLRLDPAFTEVVELDRIDEPDASLHRVADAGLLLGPFLQQARGTVFLEGSLDGTIRACNSAIAALLDVPASDLVGRPLWNHLTDPDAALLRARIAGERRPGERIRINFCGAANLPRTFECHLDLLPDGFVLVGERDLSGIERLDGELIGANNELAVMARERGQALARAQRAERERERLLDRERQARAEAEEANRRKDEILAMVSHDLRAPLGAIVAWARLLMNSDLDAAGGKAVEAILRNAEAQAALIEDLLDQARERAGRLRLNPQPIDPAAVVESLLESERPAAEAKGVLLRRVVKSQARPLVLADPARLEQALGNLVANAVKFTPKGGRVEVRIERDGDCVAIRVQDTGEGIDPTLLPYVFDRFRQGQRTGPSSGVGLGLAIARDLVEIQGGTIEAASDGRGRGAVFTVRLPAHLAESKAAIPPDGTKGDSSSGPAGTGVF
jgi:signal transduction histidine kinase/heme-degrading monooxygenase HmoA